MERHKRIFKEAEVDHLKLLQKLGVKLSKATADNVLSITSEISKESVRYDNEVKRNTKLPKSLLKHADKEVSVSFEDAPRENQNPEDYGASLSDSGKNHDTQDTWYGIVTGTVQDVWTAMTQEDYNIDTVLLEELIMDDLEENGEDVELTYRS